MRHITCRVASVLQADASKLAWLARPRTEQWLARLLLPARGGPAVLRILCGWCSDGSDGRRRCGSCRVDRRRHWRCIGARCRQRAPNVPWPLVRRCSRDGIAIAGQIRRERVAGRGRPCRVSLASRHRERRCRPLCALIEHRGRLPVGRPRRTTRRATRRAGRLSWTCDGQGRGRWSCDFAVRHGQCGIVGYAVRGAGAAQGRRVGGAAAVSFGRRRIGRHTVSGPLPRHLAQRRLRAQGWRTVQGRLGGRGCCRRKLLRMQRRRCRHR